MTKSCDFSYISRVFTALIVALLSTYVVSSKGALPNAFDEYYYDPGTQKPEVKVPHCTRTSEVLAKLSQRNYDTQDFELFTHIQTSLSMGQSACFELLFEQDESLNRSDLNPGSDLLNFNGSLVYSFTFEALEQRHPVRSVYKFAIPNLKSDCVCDCSGGEDHCTSLNRFSDCSSEDSDALCYHTFKPNQPGIGCPFGGSSDAEACCKVTVSKDPSYPTYKALYISQPSTQVRLRYLLYHTLGPDRTRVPKILEDRSIEVSINQDQTVIINRYQLELLVSGAAPLYRIPEGSYFTESDAPNPEIRSGLPINLPEEWDLGKLGWFRRNETEGAKSKWAIKNGAIKIDKAQYVITHDCKQQKYSSIFDAEFYVTDEIRWNHSVGAKLASFHPWLQSATHPKNQRFVEVKHKSSPPMYLNIKLKGSPKIVFGHHESRLGDFFGTIRLDKYSNHYLNITFTGDTSGTLIGAVYKDRRRRSLDRVLSTYVSGSSTNSVIRQPHKNVTQILELSTKINGSRWVCFYPSSRPANEKCNWLTYQSEPLEWYVVPSRWVSGQGICDGCNELTMTNIWKYLNPKQWLNGISSTSEALAMGLEVGFYVIVFIVIFCACRKVVCPILKWSMCNRSSKGTRHKIKPEV